MKNLIFTMMSIFLAFGASAQLINDGGTIVVEAGAVLFIESSLNNNTVGGTVGTIDIQGTGIVEVQGDVVNAGTITMADDAKLIFSGTAASNVTSGGATFTNVEMDKTTEDVTLMDAMTVSQDLNFVGDDNKLILGANDLTFGTTATITSADDNEYIQADAAGVVSKMMDANGMFKFEIGDATDYTPLEADVTADTYTAATLDVNVVAMEQPNIPSNAADHINRYWNVDQTGMANYSNALTGTFVAGDVDGTAANIVGAHYSTDWSYTDAGGSANTVTGTVVANGDFTGTNSFGKVNVKVFLQGAFSGGSMTTTLNNNNLIPLVSPYDASVSVASIPAGVTDWIEVELRDDTTPATILSTTSAFVMSDGSVVGLDGVALPSLINPTNPTGYIGINHRNHLGIRTSSALSLDPSSQTDLSDLANVYDNGGSTDPMKLVTGSTYAMFAGNANGNGNVRYSGPANDNNVLLNTILGGNRSGIITNVYSDGDFNMNGTVRYSGPANDNNVLLNSVLGGNRSGIISRHN